MKHSIKIGTAGWSIPKQCKDSFPTEGTHLQRYAAGFTAVEINSSFYRPHKASTYARWAASVPSGFRFAVKVPREITHECGLADIDDPLRRFLSEIQLLADKLGPLLVQLPPSLGFEDAPAELFFERLRAQFAGDVVCEPRHPSWFTDAVDRMLSAFRVARVAADPAITPSAADPGGWSGLVYRRLHGSPKIYYSAYAEDDLRELADKLAQIPDGVRESWCIFDNTALGEACVNALSIVRRL